MQEQVAQAVDNFINSPVGSIITGVLGVILVFIIIFAKTSLGKRLFSQAQRDIREINEIARLSNEKAEQVKILATDKINSLQSEYERKSAVLVSLCNELEKGLLVILAEIPNQKVKNAIDEFLVKYDEKKKEILENFPTYDEFIELTYKAREIQEQVEEIKSTYEDTLLKLREEYELKFKEIEDKLNERKEEINA